MLSARIGEDELRSPALDGPPDSAVYALTTASTAMIWSLRCRSSISPSFPARGVETQDDLDDRTLPDRLRSLHRHLDRY
jgi:hypothetical protein